MKIFFGFLIPVVSIVLMLGLSGRVSFGLSISKFDFVNKFLNYQVFVFLLSICITGITVWLVPGSSKFLTIGKINADVVPLKWLGIKAGSNWLREGLSLVFVISLVTSLFLYFDLKPSLSSLKSIVPLLGWIILFSLTNSLAEELIFRFSIHSWFNGLVEPRVIFLISAVLFGVAHVYGTPSGIVGVVLAGLLGLILSKSVNETQGLFWAWIIHFAQDVLIISTLFLIELKVKS